MWREVMRGAVQYKTLHGRVHLYLWREGTALGV